jgi:hypothetical protein
MSQIVDYSAIDELDEIFELENDFFNNDKLTGYYYIGNYSISKDMLLLSSSISINTFFKYNFNDVLYYLYYSSVLRYSRRVVDIMKLHINELGFYTVCIKTYWLRLVQRHIKKYYYEKVNILLKRCHPRAQYYFQIYGKYPFDLRLPTMYGLLSCYRND